MFLQNKSNKIFGIFAATVVIASSLSACGSSDDNNPEHAKILAVFGSKADPADANSPTIITKEIDDCVGLLSGLDSDLYTRHPKEMRQIMVERCQATLQKLVDDKTKNQYGYSMKSFENRSVAASIREVKEKVDEKIKAENNKK